MSTLKYESRVDMCALKQKLREAEGERERDAFSRTPSKRVKMSCQVRRERRRRKTVEEEAVLYRGSSQ